jgi:hypothetical protein
VWLGGIPALAGGLAIYSTTIVAAAAWCLVAATLVASAQLIVILRHAYVRSGRPRA